MSSKHDTCDECAKANVGPCPHASTAAQDQDLAEYVEDLQQATLRRFGVPAATDRACIVSDERTAAPRCDQPPPPRPEDRPPRPTASAATTLPREVFVRELEVGSWATFDPIYGPEKVLSIDRFVLTTPADEFAQCGFGVEVLHLQVGSRFITRSAYEPVLEVRRDDA